MSEAGPGAGSPIGDAIRAFYPYLPYVVVLSALWAAVSGAEREAWLPLLVAGAALIKPGQPS